MNRIFEIIDELDNYVEDSNTIPFQKNKIIVSKDVMVEFISEIRRNLPREFETAEKIIQNQEHLMELARQKAEAMEEDSMQRAESLIDQHEITRQARQKAEDMLAAAEEESKTIRLEALRYTDELLERAQKAMEAGLKVAGEEFERLERSLVDQLEMIEDNRQSLREN